MNQADIFLCLIIQTLTEQSREKEIVVKTAGGDTPGVWISAGTYHSLDATDCISVIVEAKAGKYAPETTEEFLLNE